MHCPFDETLCVEQHKETEEWVCAKCGWSSLTGQSKAKKPIILDEEEPVKSKKGK